VAWRWRRLLLRRGIHPKNNQPVALLASFDATSKKRNQPVTLVVLFYFPAALAMLPPPTPRPPPKNNQPAALLASFDAASRENNQSVALVAWFRFCNFDAASLQKKTACGVAGLT